MFESNTSIIENQGEDQALEELKDRHQWVCWDDREGKKIPINPHTGRNASSTDHSTWGTYDEAVNASKKWGLSGIGFVLTDDDPFVCIDLDDCFDGEQFTLEAARIIKDLDSYTEFSPSGKGVHIWVKGGIPKSFKINGVEVYKTGRYMTWTGRHNQQGTPTRIEQRDEALQSLYERYRPKQNEPQRTIQPARCVTPSGLNYGQKALEDEVSKILSAPEGSRNIQVNKSAFKMAQLVATGQIDETTGKNQLLETAITAGLGEKESRDTIQSGFSKGMLNPRYPKPRYDSHSPGPEPVTEPEPRQDGKWARAEGLFPKGAPPWEAFPPDLSQGLKQLGRSCATSVTSLLGAVIAILASVLGGTIVICPKSGWEEPLIFWFADIRGSGSGKTPAARKLMKKLIEAQIKACQDYEKALSEWESQDKKERGPEPKRERGYFMTDLTIEGLREDITGHGGMVCVLDELSSLISGQNQYRSGKGSDRESWLQLHDGNTIRIVRVGKSKLIKGARLNLFGGIQPTVWRSVFGGDKGLYLTDGTIYRLLPVYEAEAFYPLDGETWDEDNQATWENLLERAMKWADGYISNPDWKPFKMHFNQESQQLFFDWRNELESNRYDLPDIIKGFLPKIVGAAVRLTGIIHCINQLSKDQSPKGILDIEDVRRGISAAEFYLGHIVEACQVLSTENFNPGAEVTEQTKRLAETLSALKPDIDSGRLAIGLIHERFNAGLKPELQIKTSKSMGAFIRSCGLQITPGRHSANGKTGVHCLAWDEKIENFITINVHEVHKVHKPLMDKDLNPMDIEK